MGPCSGAAVSPDTYWIATNYWKGGGTAVWNARTGEKVHELGRNGGYVTFSPDNRWLLVGSAHKYTVWATSNWQAAVEFNRETTGELVGAGAFSHDGKLLAICPQVNQVQLISLASKAVLATLNSPIPKNIGWVGFSPDGSTLAAATFDNRLKIRYL